MADGAVIPPCPSEGRLLAEVVSVCLENLDSIDGEGRCKLYGTIKIADSVFWMDEYLKENSEVMVTGDYNVGRSIYDRAREDYESIKPGEIITLTGPFPCIEADDTFTVGFDLWNHDNDDEVVCGHFSWIVRMYGWDKFDVLLSEKVDGLGGSLRLNYALFSDAVQAFIEVRVVRLVKGDGEHSAHVYGSMGARNNLLDDEIRLFLKREPKEYVRVTPGDRITLSRSVVAASLGSLLTVRADLFSKDGEQVAEGSVDFMPELSGTSTKNITGQYGEIEVKIIYINF